MTDKAIHKKIIRFISEGKSLFMTSSFQTQSLPLLHIISLLDIKIPIYFIDTGFLFPETLNYIDDLKQLFDLNIVRLKSEVSKINQRDTEGNLLFASDPDYCCHINKIKPMEAVVANYDIWISGIRSDQNLNRSTLKQIEKSLNDKIRFHPMLLWTKKDVYEYIKAHRLPKHPLESKGYVSIGCEPCTRKSSYEEKERTGRWFGLTKTECGLHTDFIKK